MTPRVLASARLLTRDDRCGLRYARSRAKKEGHQTQSQRRRKTSTTAKQTLLSTTSPYSSHGSVRRLYDHGSYSSSAGPPPPVDVYSHTNGSMGPDMTPSPSPPGTTMSFMPYPEARPTYTESGSYYTTSPSTLSSSAMSHTNEASHMQSGHPPIACTQLPPISTYVDRLVPSGSPLAHHPSFASTLPPASYERDRERDREYRSALPTPLSAEPRMKREILSQH